MDPCASYYSSNSAWCSQDLSMGTKATERSDRAGVWEGVPPYHGREIFVVENSCMKTTFLAH